jgi:hypothetical protein
MTAGFVSSRMKGPLLAVSLALFSFSTARACTLATGYFYQVTALKGHVVGTHGRFIFAPRWFRQSFIRRHAKLALYEYRQPWDESLLVKTLESDERGTFDFGPLKIGHYVLRIDDSDLFDVEIKDMPRITESVTIDVSPINPDCSGGHEFSVNTK